MIYGSKILIVLLISTISSYCAYSQKDSFKEIQNSKQYIWGYGQSPDPDKANKLALEDLLTKISVHVESNFEYITEEDNDDFHEYSKSVIKTYSNATLSNTQERFYEKKGKYYILRFINVNVMQKVFDLREDKIRSYLNIGSNAQRELRIGDALRNYYYAYALYLSHPYQSGLTIKVDNTDVLLGILLRDRINSIFSETDFEISSSVKYDKENKTKYIINCTYDGAKVENLDFRYNNSHLHEVNNGQTEVFLYGAEQEAMDKLNIRIEYKYETKCHDKELTSVLNTVSIPFFRRSAKSINLPQPLSGKKVRPKKTIVPEFETVNKLEDSKSYYSNNVKSLLIAIAEEDYPKADEYFTTEGKQMFNKLLQYGEVSVLPIKDTLKIIQLNNETVVRSVPMAFYFKNSSKRFMENVVFTYNNQRKISAISFAVSDQTIEDIVNHGDKFGTIRDKYTLIKFMEYYKTSYSLERLTYIESIFSDEALIIVGTVLKRKQRIDGMYDELGENAVKYQRYTKKEYIERLENVFKSQEYINIDFDEAVVRKVNGQGKIYGIQISQHYYSSNYSDFGYLFLMIDLNDSLNPTIYVRTWQPKKNGDGSIYGLEDFRMN